MKGFEEKLGDTILFLEDVCASKLDEKAEVEDEVDKETESEILPDGRFVEAKFFSEEADNLEEDSEGAESFLVVELISLFTNESTLAVFFVVESEPVPFERFEKGSDVSCLAVDEVCDDGREGGDLTILEEILSGGGLELSEEVEDGETDESEVKAFIARAASADC